MAEMEEHEKMLADPSLQRKNAEHFESQANETQMDTPSSAEKSEKDGLAETPPVSPTNSMGTTLVLGETPPPKKRKTGVQKDQAWPSKKFVI